MGPQFLFYRPLIAGTVSGLILGDVWQGMAIAAVLELMWLGITGMGASLTLDLTASSIIATAFGIISGRGAPAAILIAVPAAILLKKASTLARKANDRLIARAYYYAGNGDTGGIERTHLCGLLSFLISKGLPVFLAVGIIGPFVKSLFDVMPAFLMNGLTAASGIVPAIGYGAVLGFMFDKKLVAFLIISYIVSAYLKVPTIAFIISGLVAALIYMKFFDHENHINLPTHGDSNGKLDGKILKRTFFRLNFLQFSINLRCMQNIGYAFCMIPGINYLYKNNGEKKESLKRHLDFFNTNPFFAAAILGINLSMEEAYGSAGAKSISSVKSSLMGALGGTGDSIVWFTMRPIIMSISAAYAMEARPAGIIAAVGLFDLSALIFKWYSLKKGYENGLDFIKIFNGSSIIRKLSVAGVILGFITIGGLMPKTITFSMNLPVPLQFYTNVIINIISAFFPLLLTLFVWTQVRRGRTHVTIAAVIAAACILLGALNLIA
jgi:Phosphotransferase system, mannose/fructose/N-acetylgalactosamine-specific component IID